MRISKSLLILLSITFLIASPLVGQEEKLSKQDQNTQKRIAWLKKHAIKLKSSNPAKNKFKDLMFLKEKIGDARIVLIGEQTHGHGTSQRMKSRLIRFLHEEMGFNVLAWESSMPCCRQVDQAFLESDDPVVDLLDLGVFAVFAWPKYNQPLFEYIKEIRGGENPLIQDGFDFQFSSSDCRKNFPDYVSGIFNDAQAGLLPADKVQELKSIMSDTTFYNSTWSQDMNVRDMADYLLNLFYDNEELLKQHYSDRELAYEHRVLLNFKLYVLQREYFRYSPAVAENLYFHRDKVMADTLIFLARKYYPNEKIIVWAATYHNLRNSHLIKNESGDFSLTGNIIMGDFVAQELEEEIYSIGFITYEGSTGWTTTQQYDETILPAKEGSLAWYFHQLGGKYYFVDFKSLREKSWLRKEIPARIIFTNEYQTASWPEIFDAMIYIKKTSPCEPVEERKYWW